MTADPIVKTRRRPVFMSRRSRWLLVVPDAVAGRACPPSLTPIELRGRLARNAAIGFELPCPFEPTT